jgi:predicted dinucleotide-binding enzyme
MKHKIAIAGIGNLGWNLAQRLHEQDFEIKQIIAEIHKKN